MFKAIRRYWEYYGGLAQLFWSPYLVLAIILSFAVYPLWLNRSTTLQWPDLSINIIPSLMGFSIAGMTVLLAYSHPRSLRAITDHNEKSSYFVQTFANLFHFLCAQLLALLLGIAGKGFSSIWLSYFGTLALIYAVLTSLAVAGQLFNTARIINKAAAIDADEKKNCNLKRK